MGPDQALQDGAGAATAGHHMQRDRHAQESSCQARVHWTLGGKPAMQHRAANLSSARAGAERQPAKHPAAEARASQPAQAVR